MKRILLVGAGSLAATVLLASGAMAQCQQQLRQIDERIGQVSRADTTIPQRDVRRLRSAAQILADQGMEQACARVVTAMNDLLDNQQQSQRQVGQAQGGRQQQQVGQSDMGTGDRDAIRRQQARNERQQSQDQAATITDSRSTRPVQNGQDRPSMQDRQAMQNRQAMQDRTTTTDRVGTGWGTGGAVRTSQTRMEAARQAQPVEEASRAVSLNEMLGSYVYSSQTGESVGDIEDVVLGAGEDAYVIISHGGMLGLGGKSVKLPLNALFVNLADNTYYVGLTEQDFNRAQSVEWRDNAWVGPSAIPTGQTTGRPAGQR
jgi:hypothetical protein